jgi:biopolymer transport protein ExbB
MSGRIRLIIWFGALLTLSTAISTMAATLEEVSAALEKKLGVATATYREQSAAIAEEKIPLIQEINQLEQENIDLRARVAASLAATAEDNKQFEALENRRDELKIQSEFSGKFLQEYLDAFETRLHPAEDQFYKDQLLVLRESLADAKTPLVMRFERQLEGVRLGVGRIESLVGGHRVSGRVVGPGGIITTGDFAVFGPSVFFAGKDGPAAPLAGMLQHHSGTIEPILITLEGPRANEIYEFVGSGQGQLPLDVSLGNAVAVLESNVRLIDHVRRGGPVGYAILALGAVAMLLSLVKLVDLGRFRTVDSSDIGGIVREARGNREAEAIALIGPVAGPVREMLELGIQNIKANTVLLEELMLSIILRKRPTVERFLPFLAITAAAAPLLGLLGTVVGMIRTFALITVFGTGDPRALSSGISEALITTELGLMVAIPTLILHGIFSRMIRRRFGDMERVAFEFVKNLSLQQSKSLSE